MAKAPKDEGLVKRLAPGEARYVVKERKTGRSTTYQVYDRAMASIPALRLGFGRVAQDHPSEAAAQAEADRLTAFDRDGGR